MEISIRPLGTDAAVVKVVGENSVYSAPKLRSALLELAQAGRHRLVLDLTGLEFMDSTGLGVIIGGLKRTVANGGGLSVVCTEERILKIFRITGLSRVFRAYGMFSTEDAAVRHILRKHRKVDQKAIADSAEIGGNWGTVRVFLENEEPHEAIEAALNELLKAFQIEVMYSFDPVIGSWFREYLIHTKQSGALAEQLAKMERALDMQTHLRFQAEVDARQGDAVARIIMSLEKTPNAIIQVGSVLLVKVGDDLAVRNLTQRELVLYERNPHLFRDPASAFQALQQMLQNADEPIAETSEQEG